MIQRCNIWVAGGDERQGALARMLAEDGHTVHTYGLERADGMLCERSLRGLERADCLILPLPAAGEDGNLHTPLSAQSHSLDELMGCLRPGSLVCAGLVGPRLRELAEAQGVLLRDYFQREELAVLNAVPTAEGAIQIAMERLPITLHDSRVMLVGFGRIGRLLAPRLLALGASVTVAARSHAQQAQARAMGCRTEGLEGLKEWLCSYDLLINTVPAPVLGVEELAALKEGALVIDLASRPGGVDFASAAALGVQTVWALSLPGKVAPVSAGHYIKETVYHIMEELGV